MNTRFTISTDAVLKIKAQLIGGKRSTQKRVNAFQIQSKTCFNDNIAILSNSLTSTNIIVNIIQLQFLLKNV